MSHDEAKSSEEIVANAFRLPPSKRTQYVRELCGHDSEQCEAILHRLNHLEKSNESTTFSDQGSGECDELQSSVMTPQEGIQESTIIQSHTPNSNEVIASKYRLLKRIGRGGMGVVWLAQQIEPIRRKVAIKLIREVHEGAESIVARFDAERQAIAMMEHSNISKLLDAGTTDNGLPFFVMEYVQGLPLLEYCEQHKLDLNDKLSLFVTICSAVQHAHHKGIIHRDLKPSNILVESQDGRPCPKIIDFGLAKAVGGIRLSDSSIHTGVGAFVGTPLYMAPEQAVSGGTDVDTRADIYSLGVILYELITGTTPITREVFRDTNLHDLMKMLVEEEPTKPSSRLESLQSSTQANLGKKWSDHG